MAILSDHWSCRIDGDTGWPGVKIICLDETARFVCISPSVRQRINHISEFFPEIHEFFPEIHEFFPEIHEFFPEIHEFFLRYMSSSLRYIHEDGM